MGVLDQRFEKNFMITSVDYVFNWARKSAIWPLTFGLACCAIEMIASTTSRFDMARFGAEVFRPSPRQADLMIVAGTVTLKMAPVLKRVWEQMPDPKWCISMGACSSVGGPFNAYSVLQGVDRIVPVDVYVVGCPPRPEGLFFALLKLQDKIDQMTFARAAKTNEITPGTIREFQVEGKAIALANVGGKFYAINNTCLHRGGPLGQGVMDKNVVTCPWHGWQYDVTTGKISQNPTVGVDCYRIEVRGEDIFVDADSPC